MRGERGLFLTAGAAAKTLSNVIFYDDEKNLTNQKTPSRPPGGV